VLAANIVVFANPNVACEAAANGTILAPEPSPPTLVTAGPVTVMAARFSSLPRPTPNKNSYFINKIVQSNERCVAKRHKNQLHFSGRSERILINIWVQLTLL